jgi:hypothetical protein
MLTLGPFCGHERGQELADDTMRPYISDLSQLPGRDPNCWDPYLIGGGQNSNPR